MVRIWNILSFCLILRILCQVNFICQKSRLENILTLVSYWLLPVLSNRRDSGDFLFSSLSFFGYPAIVTNLLVGRLHLAWIVLRDCLEVFIIVFRKEGNVAHFKGTRLPLISVRVALQLCVLRIRRRKKCVAACVVLQTWWIGLTLLYR